MHVINIKIALKPNALTIDKTYGLSMAFTI